MLHGSITCMSPNTGLCDTQPKGIHQGASKPSTAVLELPRFARPLCTSPDSADRTRSRTSSRTASSFHSNHITPAPTHKTHTISGIFCSMAWLHTMPTSHNPCTDKTHKRNTRTHLLPHAVPNHTTAQRPTQQGGRARQAPSEGVATKPS